MILSKKILHNNSGSCDTNYSHWWATKDLKRPTFLAKETKEKTDDLAEDLRLTFQPHPSKCDPKNIHVYFQFSSALAVDPNPDR